MRELSTATPPVEAITTATPPPSGPQAKIQIVWPHDGAPVSQADLANITAYLFEDSRLNPVACNAAPVVRLWAAENSEPAVFMGFGQKRLTTISGRTFPVWDFNDVEVSAAHNPNNALHFFVTLDGQNAAHNIWSHGVSAITKPPALPQPVGASAGRPLALDARIVSLQPAGNLPISQAARGVVTVYLFAANSLQAATPDHNWQPDVRLHWAVNNDVDQAPAGLTGLARTIVAGGVVFTAWDFSDFDLSLARNPANKLYLWADVPGVPTFSNVWVYGADVRTNFPAADLPARSCR